MERNAVLWLSLIVCCMLMITSCSSSRVSTSGGKTVSTGAIQVTTYRLSCDVFACYVNGTAKVNRDCSYASVEFRLLSSSGELVGSALANEVNLKKGDTWRFSAIGIVTDKPSRAELAQVTSF